MKISIGIVEDQQKIIDRLRTRLSFFEDLHLTLIARNGDEALQQLADCPAGDRPQVLLMDIEMPGRTGIETALEVKSIYPDIEILMQTVFEDRDKIFRSIRAGASGYLLKDDPIQKYVDAIREVAEGGAALSAVIASKVLDFVQLQQKDQAQLRNHAQQEFSLTDREMDVLKGIVDDLTEQQIGDSLFISPHTVKTHIKNIYKKLHVHSRASAVRFALSKGLVDL